MKARIPVTNAQRKVIEQEVKLAYERNRQKEAEDLTRRLFKTMIFVLHNEFGFGHNRALKALMAMTKTIEHSDEDEIFWEHIDKVVIKYLKLPFDKRDYTERGRAVTDD